MLLQKKTTTIMLRNSAQIELEVRVEKPHHRIHLSETESPERKHTGNQTVEK